MMDDQINILFSYLMSKGLRREALVVKSLHNNFVKNSGNGFDEERFPFGAIEETPEFQMYEELEETQEYQEAMEEAPSDLGVYEDYMPDVEPPEPPRLGEQPPKAKELAEGASMPALLAAAEEADKYSEKLELMKKSLSTFEDPLREVRLLNDYGLKEERMAIFKLFGVTEDSDPQTSAYKDAEDFVSQYGIDIDASLSDKEMERLERKVGKERLNEYLYSGDNPALAYVRELVEYGFDRGIFKTKDGRRRRDEPSVKEQLGIIDIGI